MAGLFALTQFCQAQSRHSVSVEGLFLLLSLVQTRTGFSIL